MLAWVPRKLVVIVKNFYHNKNALNHQVRTVGGMFLFYFTGEISAAPKEIILSYTILTLCLFAILNKKVELAANRKTDFLQNVIKLVRQAVPANQAYSLSILTFTCLQYKSFENTVGKGEIARNEQFLLFPQCFLTA